MNDSTSALITDATMLEAALNYAADGWPVFPCNPTNKRPMTANGFKDASTDPEQIRQWWTKHPNAMIGMATGRGSGVWVLDLDIDPDKGLDGIAAAAELGTLPDCLTARTPRGGLHCYFHWQEGLGNSRGSLPAGIDVRGEGGYVILPLSTRADGEAYSWASRLDLEPVEAPEWLLKQILRKADKPESSAPAANDTYAGQDRSKYAHAALERECASVAGAAEGTRNEALNRAAFALGQLIAGGMLDEQVVRSRLLAAAGDCGLPDQEAEKTIASGLAAGGKEPLGMPEARRVAPNELKRFQDDRLTTAGFALVGAHDYHDAKGRLLYQTLRYEHPCGAVRFLMRRPGPPGSGIEWVGDAGLVRVPYRLQEFADRPDEPIYFCSGEQDADRLAAAGLLATTLAEQKWSLEAARAYTDRNVVIVLANDDAGRVHEANAIDCLRGFAATISVVRLPELRRGQGVNDWLDHSHTVDDLRDLAALTPPVGLNLAPCPWIDEKTIPPRTWLYKPHYIRQFISLLISTGGVGKSSLAIVEALSMVSGKQLLGVHPRRLRVLVWNGEDPLDELHRRFAAAIKHYGLTEDEIGDRLFIVSGRTTPIVIASEENRQVVVHEHVIQEIIATVCEHNIDVLIIDPFVTCHRVNENDNAAMERVAKAWAHIAEAGNCAVMLVHHSVKPRGDELTVDHGRGASALLAAARTARVINTMSKSEADLASIEPEDRRLYFRADVGKANLMRAPADADWFKMISVALLNDRSFYGDDVGVVTQWLYPQLEVLKPTPYQENNCQWAIMKGGPWRLDQRSKKEPWVGVPIAKTLGLDPESKKDRKAVVKLIERWIETEVLIVVEREDSHREKRKYVEAGETAKVADAAHGDSAADQNGSREA